MLQKEDFAIVIGASAGGMNAIIKVLTPLQTTINAAIFIVIHISQKGSSKLLMQRLQSNTSLRCHVAENDMPIEKGHVYLAETGHHLIIKEDKLLLGNGPAEGRWRPSIDVALRSAAAAWDTHAIGIVLTGMLDDGTIGMEAIKRCGGTCIIQDPHDAEYPDMPNSVLRNVEVDYCVGADEIHFVIEQCIANANIERAKVPDDIKWEAKLTEKAASNIQNLPEIGEHSNYTCPDCGGNLWQVKNSKISRYRCHTGHAYTERDLLLEQAKNIEGTLWVALRMMEERRNLLNKIARQEETAGLKILSAEHQRRADEIAAHVDHLKEILFTEHNENAGEKDGFAIS